MHARSCQYRPFKVASAVKQQAGKGRDKTSAKIPPKHFAKAHASNVKQHDEDDTSGTPHCTNSPTAHSVLNVGKQELCMAEDNCQKTTVTMLLSQFDYTCGNHITPPSHSLHGFVVVRMDTNCSSPIEAPFHSSAWDEGTYDFTQYVGADRAERDAKLKQSFKTVFPICAAGMAM